MDAYTAIVVLAIVSFASLAFLGQQLLLGYGREKGKRLATNEDIERILSEVRLVTKEAETIKAEISGGLWEKQARWNQKRDVYARLLGHATELLSVFSTAKDGADELPDPFQRALEGGSELIRRLNRTLTEARLFLSEQANATANSLVAQLNRAQVTSRTEKSDDNLDPLVLSPDGESKFDQEAQSAALDLAIGALTAAIKELTAEAHKELGLKT